MNLRVTTITSLFAVLLLVIIAVMPVFIAYKTSNTTSNTAPSPLNPDVPPWINVTDPDASNPTADDLYIINWTDSDPDDNATINLYFDFDNVTGGEFLIGMVPEGENSTNDSYYWDTSGVPPGKYYIKAMINDTNDTFYNYSVGYLNIDHPSPGDLTQPVFNQDLSPGAGTTGDNFTFKINVTDDNWVGEVYVEYWIGSGGHTNDTMSWAGWTEYSNYTFTIILPHTIDLLYYFFSARDTSSPTPNWNNTTVMSAPIQDNDAPVPQNGSGDFSLIIGQPFTIYANFTDNINVTNATIYYNKINATGYKSKSITEGPSEGEFAISNVSLGINTTYDDDDYIYYIIANDSYNNFGFYWNQTQTWKISIIDPVGPISVDGSGDITVTTGDQFTIYANFTDNVNVDNATLYLKPEYGLNYSVHYMVEGGVDGNFTITYSQLGLDTSTNDSNFVFYVIGKDNQGTPAFYNDSGNDWNITVVDNDAPVLTQNSGDFQATTGDIFQVDATVADNINLTYVSIFFKMDTETVYHELEMFEDTNMPGDYFITSINLTNATGVETTNNVTDYTYYFYAMDHENNGMTFYNSTNPWKITVVDNDAPVIVDGSGDYSITTGETFTIYANFTDNIAVESATIFYKLHETAPEKSKPMQESAVDGQFSIDNSDMLIFTDTDDDDYIYWITAVDEENNQVIYNDPVDYYYSIIIIDDDDPEIVSGTGDIDTTTGEDFTIYANFTDNIDVDNATIYVFYKSTPIALYKIGYMLKDPASDDNEGLFSITNLDLQIETTNDDTDYIYYIIARDSEGNFVNHTSTTHTSGQFQDYYWITVTDNDSPSVLGGTGDILATTGETFRVYANFTDNIGIEVAEIFYKTVDDTIWNTAEMTRISTMNHVGQYYISNIDLGINTTLDDTDYEYYVTAKDKNLLECQYCTGMQMTPWSITVLDNDAPSAVAGADMAVNDGTEVSFDAGPSTDNIMIENYTWEFIYEGQETFLDGVSTSFVFNTQGNYFVTLTVQDAEGNEDTDPLWVNVTYIDRISPIVLSVSPANRSSNVPIDVIISVKFDEPMDIDGGNITYFKLEDPDGIEIQGEFTYTENFDQDLYILTFTPSTDLDYQLTYTAAITTVPQDLSGNNLASPVTWWFETIAEDSDEDGLPDWWEEEYFGESKINEVGPSADPDEDGFTNLEEYEADTDPTRKSSHPPEPEPKDDDEDYTMATIAGIIIVIIVLILIFIIFIKKKSKEWEDEVNAELKGEDEGEDEAGDESEPEAEDEKDEDAVPEPEEGEESEPEPGAEGEEGEDEGGEEEEPEAEEPGDDAELEAADEELDEELDAADEELEEEQVDEETEEDEKLHEEDPVGPSPEDQDMINKYRQKGTELYQNGEYAEAIVEWQKILELEPDHPEIMDSIQEAMAKLSE
jgi:hypothetical protein